MLTHALVVAVFLQGPDQAPIVKTTVREVTVYPSEALVTREGKVTVTRGQNRFRVPDLPVGLADDSIRVRTQGGAAVVGVDVVADSREDVASAAVEDLRKRRQAKQRERDATADLAKAQLSLQQFIDSLRAEVPRATGQAVVGGQGGPPNFIEVFNFIAAKLPPVLQEMRKLAEQDGLLAAEIADLDRRLEQLQSGMVVPSKSVFVDITAQKDGEAALEVSYLIGSAGWSPSYDLRAAEDLKNVNILMNAMVVQRTGEDWSGVNLILSTAKPERGASPPILPPQFLTIASPQKYRGSDSGSAAPAREMERKVAADAEKVEFLAGLSDADLPALRVDAQVVKSGLTTQLVVPRPESVPADGRPHRVRVADLAFALTPIHFTTPKLAARAFVRSKIKIAGSTPILSGAAQVFVGNDFVGRLALPDVAVGEETEIFLGVDPGIKVERKREKAEREAPGFLGSRVKWNYSYRIDVKNASAATGAATVEVLENMPVSRDDRVKIEITKADPACVRGDKEDRERESQGFLRWRLQLAPGETKTIVLDYTISVPEDLTLIGLEK
jgi:uncharacterized protein (TIGR02231 family)